jgi:hypothetical protein
MKKILHFQLALKDNGFPLVSAEFFNRVMKVLHDKLDDEFIIVASPCVPSLLSPEDKLYNFDMSQISFEELMKMVEPEKAD